MKIDSSIKMIQLDDCKKAELWFYQYFIGKLIYFAWDTRSDFVFVLEQISIQNSDLRKNHLKIAKRVVQYLKGII